MEDKARMRLVGMLGFAMRAGKVIIGTELVCASMARRGKARAGVVLISNSASDNTREKILNKASYYNVAAEVIDIDGAELGRLLGKTFAPSAVAVADERFAKEIRCALELREP